MVDMYMACYGMAGMILLVLSVVGMIWDRTVWYDSL